MIDPVNQLRQLLIDDKELLEHLVEPVQLADGQYLFHKGDLGDAFYMIESGKVRIFTLDDNGKEITLNTMVSGEMLGELALLDLQPRSASAIAVGDCNLRRIKRNDFLHRVHTSPALAACVIQILSGRTRYMTEYIERLSLWVRMIIDGAYNEVIQEIDNIDTERDRAESAVANALGQMVKAVQQREEALRQTVAQLKIEIDQEKRQSQVEAITKSEDFQDLIKLAKQRRQSRQS